MLSRTPIFTALDPNLLASGLLPDMQKARLPLWSIAEGVEFINGRVSNRRTNKFLLQFENTPSKGLVQQRLSNGEIALWGAHGTRLYRWDQFAYAMMKDYTDFNLEKPYFDFTPYGDWMFVNRGFGQVDWWNGVTFTVLPEMPTNAQQLLKHLSFMLALGVGSKQIGVAWSDANDVSKWISGPANSAGVLYIAEFESGIKAGEPLGPVIAVYSENQMAVLSFIGSPFYFGYKVVQTGIGAVGPEAVVSAGPLNYGVSRQGCWVTDGSDFKYIDTGKLNVYLQDNVNWDAANKIIVVRNDILRTIEFHFPMGDSYDLNEAWSYDPISQSWSQVPVSSFFSQETMLGAPLQADAEGRVLLTGMEPLTQAPLLLQTKPMLMQLQSAVGLTDVHFEVSVDEIELLLHDVQNCVMRIGSSKESNGPIFWSSNIPLEIGKSTYLVPHGVPAGIYWHLQFLSTPSGDVVKEGANNVLVGVDQVIEFTNSSTWKLNLQGFMLFGDVTGSK